ncbi:unnamed protein product [Arabis nemorensis]|uniref:Uncharacterized protein n=1 Tax=Arabis nemorensis TaxID=586526 RepID=A0A565AWR6_9BRAS|nr:unnamed protein product [Arabis nemorensis]
MGNWEWQLAQGEEKVVSGNNKEWLSSHQAWAEDVVICFTDGSWHEDKSLAGFGMGISKERVTICKL